jgi:hypothetical protein
MTTEFTRNRRLPKRAAASAASASESGLARIARLVARQAAREFVNSKLKPLSKRTGRDTPGTDLGIEAEPPAKNKR